MPKTQGVTANSATPQSVSLVNCPHPTDPATGNPLVCKGVGDSIRPGMLAGTRLVAWLLAQLDGTRLVDQLDGTRLVDQLDSRWYAVALALVVNALRGNRIAWIRKWKSVSGVCCQASKALPHNRFRLDPLLDMILKVSLNDPGGGWQY
jgi:hypothetical protein